MAETGLAGQFGTKMPPTPLSLGLRIAVGGAQALMDLMVRGNPHSLLVPCNMGCCCDDTTTTPHRFTITWPTLLGWTM